jgi:hypothetical protein
LEVKLPIITFNSSSFCFVVLPVKAIFLNFGSTSASACISLLNYYDCFSNVSLLPSLAVFNAALALVTSTIESATSLSAYFLSLSAAAKFDVDIVSAS